LSQGFVKNLWFFLWHTAIIIESPNRDINAKKR
jgi:hypothetical protein